MKVWYVVRWLWVTILRFHSKKCGPLDSVSYFWPLIAKRLSWTRTHWIISNQIKVTNSSDSVNPSLAAPCSPSNSWSLPRRSPPKPESISTVRCLPPIKMNDSNVSKQMVMFIKHEAEEKVNEISVFAKEVSLFL